MSDEAKHPEAAPETPAEETTAEIRETAAEDAAAEVPGERGEEDAAARVESLEAEVARLAREADALRSEVKDLKDKWLRSAAEFDNFRKRARKEWDLLQQRTKADLVLNILSVADDFERAFSVAGDQDDDFIRGIRLIYNKFTATLEEVGVRRIEALGTAFDPAYHMAVAQIERDGAESNTVVEVVQEGYSLGDIVIRPAKVVIAK